MFAFEHAFLPDVQLERVDTGTSRHYVDSELNQYTSVTTALSVLSKRGIDEWKARVGKEEADRISNKASSKGTSLHSLAEKYLLNEDPKNFDASFDVKYLFNNFLKKTLDNNVSKIYGIEKQMYSKELRAAGTSDLICDYAGLASVCDVKSSKYIKEREKIHAYFLQCGAYAVMLKELYDLDIKQVVIIMACHYDAGIIYIEDGEKWMKKAKKFFALYHADFFKR